MKYLILSFLLITSSLMANSQQSILLSVNGKSVTVTLENNAATEALMNLLPLTVEMSPYGGFEVVGRLPQSLPTSDTQVTTKAGDIMLYQGNQLVIFYGNNTWSYTRLGRINGATSENVKEFLGSGNVTITLSVESADLKEVKIDSLTNEAIYDLNGHRVSNKQFTAGIYIVNGEKMFVRK